MAKFLVAPKSRSAGVSALLFDAWIKTRIDIDCQFDKYMRSELIALTKAELVRPAENPGMPSLFVPPLLPFRPLTSP